MHHIPGIKSDLTIAIINGNTGRLCIVSITLPTMPFTNNTMSRRAVNTT